MTAVIDTRKVSDRRQLHFGCLEDICADVESLATSKDVRRLGNWSAGQILKHLAITMNTSVDGSPPMVPGVVRLILRTFFKRRILTRPMTPGFRLPARAAMLLPEPTSFDEGLRSFREAYQRLQKETERKTHGAFGPLTRDEWDQLHCRHAELHLSFLVPVTAAPDA